MRVVNAWHARIGAYRLREGGVIAYPTEAVFGLGCDPANAEAVGRILDLKQRPMEKGLILIGADIDHILPFMAPLSANEREVLEQSWPGPVTWLVEAAPGVPKWLRGRHKTIALRVSAHPLAARLCKAFRGAIVSTSANRSGLEPARSSGAVRRAFGARLDYVVPGACGARSAPSEIRDLRSGKVLRASP